ncbi:MAG TPA: hypothetical protein VNA13_00215 [Xanthomonadales bacterium]|nr:hypothetical protein [Xanthomonadales bacterium]
MVERRTNRGLAHGRCGLRSVLVAGAVTAEAILLPGRAAAPERRLVDKQTLTTTTTIIEPITTTTSTTLFEAPPKPYIPLNPESFKPEIGDQTEYHTITGKVSHVNSKGEKTNVFIRQEKTGKLLHVSFWDDVNPVDPQKPNEQIQKWAEGLPRNLQISVNVPIGKVSAEYRQEYLKVSSLEGVDEQLADIELHHLISINIATVDLISKPPDRTYGYLDEYATVGTKDLSVIVKMKEMKDPAKV